MNDNRRQISESSEIHKKKNTINVLHISDLHFGLEKFKKLEIEAYEKRDEAFRLLKTHLINLESEWKPDMMVISGDIGFSGNIREYNIAWEWIEGLMQALGISNDNLLLCPGNHDKSIINHPVLPKNGHEANEYTREKDLLEYIIPFKDFIKFNREKKLVPLNYGRRKNFLMGGRKIYGLQFIVLNSAWFAKGGHDDDGNIYIGENHLRKLSLDGILVFNEDYDKCTLRIVIMHHPMNWFNDSELNIYQNKSAPYITLSTRTHLILSGHSHSTRVLNPIRVTENGARLFSVGAVYEHDDKHIYESNCAILKIDPNKGTLARLIIQFDPGYLKWKNELDGERYTLQLNMNASSSSSLSMSLEELVNQIQEIERWNASIEEKITLTWNSYRFVKKDLILIGTLLRDIEIEYRDESFIISLLTSRRRDIADLLFRHASKNEAMVFFKKACYSNINWFQYLMNEIEIQEFFKTVNSQALVETAKQLIREWSAGISPFYKYLFHLFPPILDQIADVRKKFTEEILTLEPWFKEKDLVNDFGLKCIFKPTGSSPYQDGEFLLQILFSENHPFEPPGVIFHTKIWHPGIYIDDEVMNRKVALVKTNLVHRSHIEYHGGWSITYTLVDFFSKIRDFFELNEDFQETLLDIYKMPAYVEFHKNRNNFVQHATKCTEEYATVDQLKDLETEPIHRIYWEEMTKMWRTF